MSVKEISYGEYEGTLNTPRGFRPTGRVRICVSPGPHDVRVTTDAYDGHHSYPYPNPEGGRTPHSRGHDPRQVAEQELARLQRLYDAGRNLWEEEK